MNTLRGTPPTDQVHSLQEKQALMERLLTIAEIKDNMPDDVTSDHAWLFGEDGLAS